MTARWPLAAALLAACHLAEPPAPARTITVVRGDTLSGIARRHGVTVDDLRAWNGLTGDLIEVGQVLRLEGGHEAAAPARPSAPRRAAAAQAVRPSRALPAPKPCLPPPELDGDEGMAASVGLDPAAARAAVDAMLPEVLTCVDEAPDGTATVAFVVGCDGRVRSLALDRDPGWPAPLTACVLEALRHAAFPAHALPEGDRFTLPLSFGP